MVRRQLGVYPFCETGVKWWGGDSWVCIRSVSQVLNGGGGDSWACNGSVSKVLNGGEGTVGCVSVP